MKIIDLIKSEFVKNYTLKKCFIIIIILLISIIGLTYFNELKISYDSSFIESELSFFEEQNDFHQQYPDENKLKNEWNLFKYEERIKIYNLIKNEEKYKDITSESWQMTLVREIIERKENNFWIEKYLKEEQLIVDWIYEDYELGMTLGDYIKKLSNMSLSELIAEQKNNLDYILKMDNILKENKFYKYIQFYINEFPSDGENNKVLYDNIIKNKIENENDYRVKNIYQRKGLSTTSYNSNRVNKLLNNRLEEYSSILDYSINKNMKQDITYGGVEISAWSSFITTKNCVNLIFPLSIVVMILVVITSGDIISKEHSKGTEKILLTSPNKRWKIHMSKFLYLILHMYIIWFTAFALFCIYAGIKYGFSDLFTSKLVYRSGSVIEVNYLLYTMKQIFYCSIPVISFISILFILSNITLNTTITIGVSMVLATISPFLWYFIQLLRLRILAYTPLPYFMFSEVMYLDENYLKTMEITNISESYGILVSIITIIVCYYVSNKIYTKRDIKNS